MIPPGEEARRFVDRNRRRRFRSRSSRGGPRPEARPSRRVDGHGQTRHPVQVADLPGPPAHLRPTPEPSPTPARAGRDHDAIGEGSGVAPGRGRGGHATDGRAISVVPWRIPSPISASTPTPRSPFVKPACPPSLVLADPDGLRHRHRQSVLRGRLLVPGEGLAPEGPVGPDVAVHRLPEAGTAAAVSPGRSAAAPPGIILGVEPPPAHPGLDQVDHQVVSPGEGPPDPRLAVPVGDPVQVPDDGDLGAGGAPREWRWTHRPAHLPVRMRRPPPTTRPSPPEGDGRSAARTGPARLLRLRRLRPRPRLFLRPRPPNRRAGVGRTGETPGPTRGGRIFGSPRSVSERTSRLDAHSRLGDLG